MWPRHYPWGFVVKVECKYWIVSLILEFWINFQCFLNHRISPILCIADHIIRLLKRRIILFHLNNYLGPLCIMSSPQQKSLSLIYSLWHWYILNRYISQFNWYISYWYILNSIFPPVAWGDQNWGCDTHPCACRRRRLIMRYELSYTTGLLYAWSSCMQWGVGVWTVGHWVILVKVIYCSKGVWVLFLKNQRHPWEEITSYTHSRQSDLPVTHSSPLSTWLSVLLFFSSPAETTLSGQGYGFRWRRR